MKYKAPQSSAFWRDYNAGKLNTLGTFKAAAHFNSIKNNKSEVYRDFFEESGWGLPPDSLVLPSVMTSTNMLKRHNLADWQHTGPILREFAARYIKNMRKLGIPIHVLTVSENYITLRHWHQILTDAEWHYLSLMAEETIYRHQIEVCRSGDQLQYRLQTPQLPLTASCGDPLRVTPAKLHRALL